MSDTSPSNRLVGCGLGTGIFLVVALIAFIFLRPWGYVENYELGYKFNARDGKISTLDHTGYNARTPFIESIYTIDTRPRQVCITVGMAGTGVSTNSANSRVLNCKLVAFNPKGLTTFIAYHGANSYDGDTLNDLLKIYAYDGSGRNYPFLTVIRELKDGNQPLGTPVNATPVSGAPVNTPVVGNAL